MARAVRDCRSCVTTPSVRRTPRRIPMDLFENPLMNLPAGAHKEGAEAWSLGAAGISGKDDEGGQLTNIMNSSTMQLDDQSSPSSCPAVKCDPDIPGVNGRTRKRRAPSEARLAQNAKAQKRYRYAARGHSMVVPRSSRSDSGSTLGGSCSAGRS